MQEQMQEVNIDREKLALILKKLNINNIKNLIILSIDKDGKVFYQTKNDKAKIVENIFKEA